MAEPDFFVSGQERLGLAAADGLIWTVFLLSPLLIGTVHPTTWLAMGACSSLAFMLALLVTSHPPPLPRLVAAVGAVWGGALALQLLPLPSGLLGLLSPESSWLMGLGVPGGSGHTGGGAVHQSPGLGSFQMQRFLVAATFAGACFLRAKDRGWRRRLPVVMILSALVASAVSLAQTHLGSDTILGLYRPRAGFGGRWHAPLVNPNHWAAYLTMAGILSLGLGLGGHRSERRSRGLALVWTAVGLFLLLQVALGASRGGFLGLGAGGVTLALLLVAVRRRRTGRVGKRHVGLAFGGSAVLVALVAGGMLQQSQVRVDAYTGGELGGLEGEARLEQLPAAARVVSAHPGLGVGRGALYDVFPRFKDQPGRALNRWIEVLPVDLVLDFGWLVGLGLNTLLLVFLVTACRAVRDKPVRAASAAALVSLAVHEIGDFSTEGGAVLFYSIGLAALALASSESGTASRPLLPNLELEKSRTRRPWLVVAGLLFLVLPLATAGPRHGDIGACLERMTNEARQGASWKDLGAAEWREHPGAFPLALAVASGAQEEGDVSAALGWLNRAQLLAPSHPEPHIRTARLLWQLGAVSQALTEFRLAIERDWRGSARSVLLEVAARTKDTSSIRALLPSDVPSAPAQFAMWLRDAGDPRSVDLVALLSPDGASTPAGRVAAVYTALDTGDLVGARQTIEEVWTMPQLDPNIRLRLAVAMGWAGDYPRSVEMMNGMTLHLDREWPSLWFSLARAELKVGNEPAARRALRRVAKGRSTVWLARALRLEAELAEAAGRAAEARGLRERAEALDEG